MRQYGRLYYASDISTYLLSWEVPRTDFVLDVMLVHNSVGAIKQYGDANQNRTGQWSNPISGYITLREMVTTREIKAGEI